MKGIRATHWFWIALGLALFAPIAIWIAPNAVIHSEGPAAASSTAFGTASSATSVSPASSPAGSPFPNLVENGDFESYFPQSRPRVWELDPDMLFFWDEFSRGTGERSLFIDAAQIEDILNLRSSKDVVAKNDKAVVAGNDNSVVASEARQSTPLGPHVETPRGDNNAVIARNDKAVIASTREASARRRFVVLEATSDSTSQRGQSHSATLRYPLPFLRPGASYLLSFWLARDRNIDGLYPTAVLGGQAFRLSDFWASGRWQKISLVVTLPRLLPPDARRLEIQIPPGDYRLWIDDIVVRRIKPEAALDRASAALVWSLPSTDRLLDIRVVLSRDARGQKDVREIWTNNVAGGGFFRRPEERRKRDVGTSFPRPPRRSSSG